MEKVQVTEASVLIATGGRPLEELLELVGIQRDNISSYGKPARFLQAKENGALVDQVAGDFTHAVDLWLFDRSEEAAHMDFSKIADKGAAVAIPDETDEDPEAYILWRKGERRLVRVVEEQDRFQIKDPLGESGLA